MQITEKPKDKPSAHNPKGSPLVAHAGSTHPFQIFVTYTALPKEHLEIKYSDTQLSQCQEWGYNSTSCKQNPIKGDTLASKLCCYVRLYSYHANILPWSLSLLAPFFRPSLTNHDHFIFTTADTYKHELSDIIQATWSNSKFFKKIPALLSLNFASTWSSV